MKNTKEIEYWNNVIAALKNNIAGEIDKRKIIEDYYFSVMSENTPNPTITRSYRFDLVVKNGEERGFMRLLSTLNLIK